MNKLLLTGALLTTTLLTATSAHAGLFASVATSGWEDKKPDHKYIVETYGYDVRVYEWTPKNNPDVSCVFVAGNENSSGVACYPKKKK